MSDGTTNRNANVETPVSGGAGRAVAALALGFASGALTLLFYRIVLIKFPLNLVLVAWLIWVGLGLAVGVAWGGGGRLRAAAAWLVPAACLCLFAAIVNQNVTTHYLLGQVYYPYPMPVKSYLRVGGLVVWLLTAPAAFALIGALYGDALRRAASARVMHGFFVLGTAVAAVAAHFAILKFGPYAPMIIVSAAVVAFAPRRALAAAGVIACAAALWVATHDTQRAFFVWKIDTYKHLSANWTPYYRVDFISFKNDHCIGGVYNTIMLWFTCDTAKDMPAEMKMLMRNVARGKKHVLLAGRTDGLYASMILDAYPDIRDFTHVDFDPVVARLMSGPYARYNGGLFKRPGVTAKSADIRQFIKKQARTGKKYDLIFLNGPGIRLFNQPRSVFFQEDYLTARENYEDIFNKLLTRDGVFVIDWGSSMEDEVVPMMANIPDGVHRRAFHFWLGEFPLTGLPLFYVVASRDRAQLDRIAGQILLLPTVREVDLNDARMMRMIDRGRHTENRPVHHKPLAPALLALMSPMFLLLFAVTAHVGFRERWQAPISPMYIGFYALFTVLLLFLFYKGNLFAPGPINQPTKALSAITFLVLFVFVARYVVVAMRKWVKGFFAGRGRAASCWWLAGFAMGLVETFVFSRLARLVPGGPGYGMMWLGAAFAAGLGAGLLMWPGRGRTTINEAFLTIWLIAIFLLNIVTIFPDPVHLIARGYFTGLAAGLAAGNAFKLSSTMQNARAVALFLLGALAGLYAFQWFVVLFGYFIATCLIILVFVKLLVLLYISSKNGRAIAPENSNI